MKTANRWRVFADIVELVIQRPPVSVADIVTAVRTRHAGQRMPMTRQELLEEVSQAAEWGERLFAARRPKLRLIVDRDCDEERTP